MLGLSLMHGRYSIATGNRKSKTYEDCYLAFAQVFHSCHYLQPSKFLVSIPSLAENSIPVGDKASHCSLRSKQRNGNMRGAKHEDSLVEWIKCVVLKS
jgi:hypothetical protein